MSDPFLKVKEMYADSKAKIKENIDRLLIQKKTEKDVFDEYVKELRVDGEEVERMMKDPKYPRSQRFMDNLRKGLVSSLERLSASGAFNQIEIARIGAKIEMLDELRGRPQRIIKELERINKVANEKAI